MITLLDLGKMNIINVGCNCFQLALIKKCPHFIQCFANPVRPSVRYKGQFILGIAVKLCYKKT